MHGAFSVICRFFLLSSTHFRQWLDFFTELVSTAKISVPHHHFTTVKFPKKKMIIIISNGIAGLRIAHHFYSDSIPRYAWTLLHFMNLLIFSNEQKSFPQFLLHIWTFTFFKTKIKITLEQISTVCVCTIRRLSVSIIDKIWKSEMRHM